MKQQISIPDKKARWFRLAALLLGILPFVLLELGLRLFNVAPATALADPTSGFNPHLRLFERQGEVYRTAAAREPFFSKQEFPVSKPHHGFRIFCFGGSTVYGHPYEAPTAFPAWLQIELAGRDPQHQYQAINCGGVSYASYRLLPIVREVMQYQPDLIVIATGHNEFLEDRTYETIKSGSPLKAWLVRFATSLRTVNLARKCLGGSSNRAPYAAQPTLSAEVQTRLDERSGYASYHRDDAWHDRVLAQFEQSVRAMVQSCKQAKVPVILVKLGSNLRDCPPFKSEHRPGLTPEQEATWEKEFEAATSQEDHDLEAALATYHRAEQIDPEFALLTYRIARVLDRLGRTKEALDYYRRAKDQDICPLRILDGEQQILEQIASETGTPLVDAAGLLAAKSPDGISGNDWYVDHVHPTIGGNQKIAQALAARVQSLGLAAAGEWPDSERRAAYIQHLQQLGVEGAGVRAYVAKGRRRVEALENWSRRERLYDETLPKDARGWLRCGFRRLEFADTEGAAKAFAKALGCDRGVEPLLRQHANELLAQGRLDEAKFVSEFRVTSR